MSSQQDPGESHIHVLIPQEAIEARCKALAAEIDAKAKGRPLHTLVVLKGAYFYASSLLKYLENPCELHFIQLSSYGGGTQSTGHVSLLTPWPNIAHDSLILIIDDILDTGLTLSYLQSSVLEKYQPSACWTTVLLKKNISRAQHFECDFTGFDIENQFVVGYGLDFQERYRNLPFVGVLDAHTH